MSKGNMKLVTPESEPDSIETLKRKAAAGIHAARANKMKQMLTLIELAAREARQRMALAERAHTMASRPQVLTPQEIAAIADGRADADPKVVAATHDHMAETQLRNLSILCVEMAEMLGLVVQDTSGPKLAQ